MAAKHTLSLLLLTFISPCFGASLKEPHPNPEEIRVVPKRRSPEPDELQMTFIFPKEQQMKERLPVAIQMRLEGFPLGVDTEMPRAHQIYNNPEGQRVRIVVDNGPHFSINEAFVDALDDYEEYYEEDMEFDVPVPLEPGMHILRAFMIRSFNESLKCPKCFATRTFYYKSKTPKIEEDLSLPYLTYNEPQGKFSYSETTPLLLDFYVNNCQLSQDGYKVRLTIDDRDVRNLTQWVPYYVYGLSKGKHKFKIELLDNENTLVPGEFASAERTILLD